MADTIEDGTRSRPAARNALSLAMLDALGDAPAAAPTHAMELLLTGEMIDTDRAAAIGLINRAVPVDELDAHVEALVPTIAATSFSTLKIGKQVFTRQDR